MTRYMMIEPHTTAEFDISLNKKNDCNKFKIVVLVNEKDVAKVIL